MVTRNSGTRIDGHQRGALAAVLAIVLGLAGVLFVVAGAGAPRQLTTVTPGTESSMVVTTHAVGAGAVLTVADVSASRVQAPGLAPGSVLHAVREAVGRRVALALPAGTPLVAALLIDSQAPQPGHRLVRLHVDAGGLPSGLRADDLVDVVAAVADAQGGGGRVVTVASGRVVSATADGATSSSPASPPGVALLLSTDVVAAGRLLWAEAFAKSLQVLARPLGDTAPAALDVSSLAG